MPSVAERADAEPAAEGSRAHPTPTPGLIFRFLLELAMLGGLAYWGWHLGDGGLPGGALAILLPAAVAALWGIFATPGDPSRGGRPVVDTPGPIRLALELALFGVAAYGLWTAGSRAAAETLLTATAIHYALSWQRIGWLLRH